MVNYQFEGAAIFTELFIEKDSSEFFGCHVCVARGYLDISTKSVGHGHDSIKTIIFRKWPHKVNCN